MKIACCVLGTIAAAALLMGDTAAGLKWTAPPSWKSQGQRPMRAATYSVPAAKGDSEGGECAVFYFGQGQGGSVDANVKRWAGQFKPPQTPKTGTKTVNGLKVTSVDIAGTYAASMGGPMMGGATVNKPGYRLLGAIVEGPQGEVFFKFTGPAKTVAANEAAFNGMVQSVKK